VPQTTAFVPLRRKDRAAEQAGPEPKPAGGPGKGTDTVSDQTCEAADRAADAIRDLVRLTAVGQDHLRCPADVSEIAAALQLVAGQLPRLLAHLTSWLTAEGRAGRIGYDGSDPARYWIGQVNACPRHWPEPIRWRQRLTRRTTRPAA
jgi:hypothetical protein